MGMFDSVLVPCTGCGAEVEYQSKEGARQCEVYTLETAPTEILTDIMNAPEHCRKCGQWTALVDPDFPPGEPPRPKLRPARVKTPTNPSSHQQGYKWWPDDVPFTYGCLEQPLT